MKLIYTPKNNEEEGTNNSSPLSPLNNKKKKKELYHPDDSFTEGFFNSLSSLNQHHRYMMTEEQKENIEKNGLSFSDPTAYKPQEEIERIKGKNQSNFNKAIHSLGQLLENEVMLGTVKGFSDLFDALYQGGSELLYNMTEGKVGEAWDTNDFTNKLSSLLESWQDKNRERLSIYRENPNEAWDIGDFGWWAENFVTVGSTASLLIPSKTIGTGLSKLAKLSKLDRVATGTFRGINKLNKAIAGSAKPLMRANLAGKNVNAWAEAATMGLISRIAENYQEARETYKNSYNNTLDLLKNLNEEEKQEFLKRHPEFTDREYSNEEMAHNITSRAADEVFKDDMWLFMFDALQFKGIQSSWAPTKRTTTAVRKAERLAEQELTNLRTGEKIAEEVGKKSILDKIKGVPGTASQWVKDFARYAKKEPMELLERSSITEAFEEGFQGINQKRAEDLIDSYFNPNVSLRGYGELISDPEVLEQAFWGVLGGLAFGASARGLSKLTNVAKGKYKLLTDKEHFTQSDYDMLVKGDNAIRTEEIRGRINKFKTFKNNMDLINDGKNPFEKLENGDYVAITTDEEQNNLKRQATNQYIQDLVYESVDSGNIDMLLEYVQNPDFAKAVQDAGGQNLDGKIIEDIKNKADRYIQTKEDVANNAYVDNEHVAQLTARAIDRAKDNVINIEEQINDVSDALEQLRNSDTWTSAMDAYVKALSIEKRVEQHNDNIAAFKRQYDNHKMSKSAYEGAVKKEQDSIDVLKRQLYNNVADNEVVRGLVNNNQFGEVTAHYRKLLNDDALNTRISINDVDESVKELAIRKINLEIARDNWNAAIPETKEEYTDLYEDMAATTAHFVYTRLGQAFNDVKKYIEKADDIEQAVNDLYDEKALPEQMKILKIGAKNRVILNKLFRDTIKDIETNRKKEESSRKKAKDNGIEVSEKESEKINDEIEASNPSTGKVEQTEDTADTEETGTTPVKEGDTIKTSKSEDTVLTPEEEMLIKQAEQEAYEEPVDEAQIAASKQLMEEEGSPSDIEEKLLKEQARELMQAGFNPDYNAFETAVPVAIQLAFSNLSYRTKIEQLGGDFINTAEYNDLRNEIIEQLTTKEAISESAAKQVVDRALRQAIASYTDRVSRIEGQDSEEYKKAKSLLEALSTIAQSKKYDEQASKLYEKSNEEIEQEMAIFFDTYFRAANVYKPKLDNGKTPIDIDSIVEYIKQLADENQWNYDNVAFAIRNLVNYYYRGSSKFEFINSSYITNLQEGNKESNNLDNIYDLLAQVYKKEFVIENVDKALHFAESKLHFGQLVDENGFYLTDDAGKPIYIDGYTPRKGHINLLNKAAGKPLTTRIIKAKDFKGNVQDMSMAIGFIDDSGNFVEIGYSALIEANAENTVLKKLDSTEGFNISIRKVDDKTFVVENKAFDELMNGLIDSFGYEGNEEFKELARIIYNNFVINNSGRFIKKDNSLRGYKLASKDYITFLQNKYVKQVILDGNFKIDNKKVTASNYDEIVENNSKELFKRIANTISDTLFYAYNNENGIKSESADISATILKSYYMDFAKRTWNSYNEQHNLQISKNPSKLIFKSDNVRTFNYNKGETKNIKDIGIKNSTAKYPFIYFDRTSGKIENSQTSVETPSCFAPGTCGILMETKNGKPFVATFKDANSLSQATDLSNAVKEHLTDLLNRYYEASGEQAYNLYKEIQDTIKSLITGRNRLFNGYKLKEGKSGFIITKPTANGDQTVIQFFAYDVPYSKEKQSYVDVLGNKIPYDELKLHYGNNTRYIDESGKQHLIVGKDEKTDKEAYKQFVEEFINGLTFNKGSLGVTRQNTSIVTFNKDGSLAVKLGNKELKYLNYTDFVVKNNAFTTTYQGRSVNTMFTFGKSGNTETRGIYVEYAEEVDKGDSSDVLGSKGLLINLHEAKVKEGDSVSGQDILRYVGIAEGDIASYEAANMFGEKGIFPEKVKISYKQNPNKENKDAFATYNKDSKDITIWGPGITVLGSRDRNTAANLIKRLLIHEQTHRVVDNEGFFISHKYGEHRANRIIDIFNKFENYIKKSNNQEWIRFVNQFVDDYGKNLDNFDARANFANEFLAEALSNKAMMEILNEIDYDTSSIIDTNARKSRTLLQKLFDIIKDLFNLDVRNNTALDALYKTIGYPTELKTFKEDNKANVETTTQEVKNPITETANADDGTSTPVKEGEDLNKSMTSEELERKFNELKDTTDIDLDLEDDDLEFDENSSKLEAPLAGLTSEEYSLDAVNKDRKLNPFGVTLIGDMDEYIHSFPIDKQAAMRSELNAGTIKFVCR